jgi:hypothetical protein
MELPLAGTKNPSARRAGTSNAPPQASHEALHAPDSFEEDTLKR